MINHELIGQQLEQKGQRIVQDAPQAFIDIDIEADGIAGMGSLLSIGAVSPWGDTFYRELRPLYSRWIDGNREFCEQHSLERERLMHEGTDPLAAVKMFAEWSAAIRDKQYKEGLVFSAFNASFDFPLVDLYMKEASIENPYGVAGFCTKSLALAVSTKPPRWDWNQTKKSRLPAELVPPGDFTHHALEDAQYQQRIHFRLAALLSDS